MKEDKTPRGQTEERKAYMKIYNATHPKRDRSEYKRKYDEENKDRIAQYRIANKQVIKKQRAEYYKEKRPVILSKMKEFYLQNKENVLLYQKEYNRKNKDKIRKREVEYTIKNRGTIAHAMSIRRARKFNNGGSHTFDELVQRFRSLGNVCFYCGCSKKLTIDHDIPLSRGGTDNIENILPACGSCNSRKRTLTALEFTEKMRTNHQLIGGVKPNQAGR